MRTPGWLALGLPAALAALEGVLVTGPEDHLARGLALLAAGGLLLRRRLPWAALLLALPGQWTGFLWFAPMFAVYGLAERCRRPWPAVLGAAVVALVDIRSFLDAVQPPALDTRTLVSVGYAALTGAAPALIGMLVRTRRELAARITDLVATQRHERLLIEERALATERARLAREMHDVVAHQVSLMSVQAAALQAAHPDPDVREAARELRRLSVTTLTELRHMVTILRAAGARGTELTPQPTLDELRGLLDSSGMAVTAAIDLPPERRWPEPVERAAYRIVQESLTNIRKHAPGAHVDVGLRHEDAQLVIDISNGPAAAPPLRLPGGGHGLLGLRERAHHLGGTLRAAAPAAGR
ncbi:sensor histidine kinase [Marinitenerispora sediminis]|uniref:sensor histidine kinase n=1 Tax=Marinitenerispora sediminis TaxID=1931232 RepID=UPI000DF49433|nr:histidine kinase [Marinitenerispora sediminis]RCV48045.1 two-component sensor histidine kinase [Marinitenerispora sediminis]